MSDNSNTGMPEDEKETSDLLALLYPEDGEASNSEFVSDELSGMQGLRSLFKDLPDEEPSDAVTNKLMALAAQHAPKPVEESKGFFAWFSDLFTPLVTHPGLAAAATLVLVVGVAGTLYVKGEAKMAKPEVASRAEAPERAISSSETASEFDKRSSDSKPEEAPPTEIATEQKTESIDSVADDELQEAPKADSATTPPGGSNAVSQDIAPEQEGKRKFKAAADSPLGGRTSKSLNGTLGASTGSGYGAAKSSAASTARRVKDIVDAPSPEPKPERTTAQAESVKRPARAKPNPKKPSATKPSPPPPPRSAPVLGDEVDEDVAEAQEKNKKNSSESVKLHNQAVAAAKRGNCKRVLSLGKQIRNLDSSYYDRTFLSDSRLTACRQSANVKKK